MAMALPSQHVVTFTSASASPAKEKCSHKMASHPESIPRDYREAGYSCESLLCNVKLFMYTCVTLQLYS